MGMNAYQLVTDLHYSCGKRNRYNYQGEILEAINGILGHASTLRDEGYNVHLILLGDVCDTSITDSEEAMQTIEILRFFFNYYDSVHCVLGNHEVTYYKANPLWYLIDSIRDESLVSYKRLIAPKGITSLVNIDSTLEDGEVCFYFNHYGTHIKQPNVEHNVNIGLFHQDVGSSLITQMWGDWVDVEKSGATIGYQYAFFGHMHLALAKYELDGGCIGEWLGSIGRTNVNEVSDSKLERNVPAVLVDDGVFKGVRDMYIHLKPYAECVDTVRAEAEKKVRKIAKERVDRISATYVGSDLKEAIFKNVAGTSVDLLCHKVFGAQPEMLRYYHTEILKEE